MFTYGPGRVPPPMHLGLAPSLIAGSFPPSDMAMSIINPLRTAKRIYVGDVTEAITEEGLKEFFNKTMYDEKLASDLPGDPVAQTHRDVEKGYAWLEVSPLCRGKPAQEG